MGSPCSHLCSGAGWARRYGRPVSDYQRILVVSTQADAAEVARVRAGIGSSAVVLTAQLNANRPATVAALRKLRDTSAVLYYAGAAFRTLSSRRGVPGTYLGGNLTPQGQRVHITGEVPFRYTLRLT